MRCTYALQSRHRAHNERQGLRIMLTHGPYTIDEGCHEVQSYAHLCRRGTRLTTTRHSPASDVLSLAKIHRHEGQVVMFMKTFNLWTLPNSQSGSSFSKEF
jgi:hypothetical protein